VSDNTAMSAPSADVCCQCTRDLAVSSEGGTRAAAAFIFVVNGGMIPGRGPDGSHATGYEPCGGRFSSDGFEFTALARACL
jgi:hypothetical protein